MIIDPAAEEGPDLAGDVIVEEAEEERWRHPSMGWTPENILRWHLIPGEQIIYEDSPSLNAMLLENSWMVGPAVAFGVLAVLWGITSQQYMTLGIALIAFGLVAAYLIIRRFRERYTMYVLTTVRIMRLSGVLKLEAYWMPWGKVTDVRLKRSVGGRLFGYASVVIESANEGSGLKELKNLRDPKTFYLKLTAMVQLKQGNAAADRIVQQAVDWD